MVCNVYMCVAQVVVKADCGEGKTMAMVAVAEYLAMRYRDSEGAILPVTVLMATRTVKQQQQVYEALKAVMGDGVPVVVLNSRAESCDMQCVRALPCGSQVIAYGFYQCDIACLCWPVFVAMYI